MFGDLVHSSRLNFKGSILGISRSFGTAAFRSSVVDLRVFLNLIQPGFADQTIRKGADLVGCLLDCSPVLKETTFLRFLPIVRPAFTMSLGPSTINAITIIKKSSRGPIPSMSIMNQDCSIPFLPPHHRQLYSAMTGGSHSAFGPDSPIHHSQIGVCCLIRIL